MEKVLVCLLASTRAHQLTFPSFKRQVLDELNGDLALALTIDEKYDYANPFWQHAKYRWTAPDFSDYGEGFDLAQRRRSWDCFELGDSIAVHFATCPTSAGQWAASFSPAWRTSPSIRQGLSASARTQACAKQRNVARTGAEILAKKYRAEAKGRADRARRS